MDIEIPWIFGQTIGGWQIFFVLSVMFVGFILSGGLNMLDDIIEWGDSEDVPTGERASPNDSRRWRDGEYGRRYSEAVRTRRVLDAAIASGRHEWGSDEMLRILREHQRAHVRLLRYRGIEVEEDAYASAIRTLDGARTRAKDLPRSPYGS